MQTPATGNLPAEQVPRKTLCLIAWALPTVHVLWRMDGRARCLCGQPIPRAGPNGWPAAVMALDAYLDEPRDRAAWASAFSWTYVRPCDRCRRGLARGLHETDTCAARRTHAALVEGVETGARLDLARRLATAFPRLTGTHVRAIVGRRWQERGR